MQFELDTLTQYISGSLSLSSLRRGDLSEPRHLLKERFPLCLKHYRVVYTQLEDSWQLHSFQRRCQDELYELPVAYPDRKYPPVEGSTYADLLPALAGYFQLQLSDIAWTTYHRRKSELIIELIVLSEFEKLEPTEIYFHYYQYLTEEEIGRIKEQWAQTIFSLPKEKTIRLYIRNHHQALIRLKEQLRHSIQETEHERLHQFAPIFCLEDTLKALHAGLDELLMHLEHQYGSYLDQEARLSYRKRRHALAELAPQLNQLQSQLSSLPDAVRKLLQVPLEHLHQLPYNHSFTYRQLAYGRYWIRILIAEFSTSESIRDETILRAMIKTDFNDLGMLDYLTRRIQQEVKRHNHAPTCLRYWIKAIRQFTVQSPLRYWPSLPSLQTQLLEWLHEELDYRESLASEDKIDALPSTIPTGLSVSQWALFLRLMHEVGIFKPQQQMDLFRTFGRVISTKRADRISVDSLQSKYYNVEEGTRKAVQEKITQMLRAVRQRVE